MLKKTVRHATQPLLKSLDKAVANGERIKQATQILFFFVGIVLAMANMFVASRLQPVLQSIGELRAEDTRLETRADTNRDGITKLVELTSQQTKILERVDERSKIILDLIKQK